MPVRAGSGGGELTRARSSGLKMARSRGCGVDAPAPLSLNVAQVQIPHYFRCPISLELMQDPVILSTGQTYDRSSIEKWVASGNTTCPVSMQQLDTSDLTLIPNHTLRRLIQEWCVANRSRGVQRIPTPKQPADLARLRAILADLSAGIAPSAPSVAPTPPASPASALPPTPPPSLVIDSRSSAASRVAAIRSLKSLIKDQSGAEASNNIKSLMVDAGAVPILISAFFSGCKNCCSDDDDPERAGPRPPPDIDAMCCDVEGDERRRSCRFESFISDLGFPDGSLMSNCRTTTPIMVVDESCEEALGVLVTLQLTDGEKLQMIKADRLALISHILQRGSSEARANAALLVETLSGDSGAKKTKTAQEVRQVVAASDGMLEGLLELVRDSRQWCAEAGVRALYSLCMSEEGKERAVQAGAASALIEMLLLATDGQEGGNRTDYGDGVSPTEKAVVMVEMMCSTEQGCGEVAKQGAAAVAALIRTMLKVSERATEAATSCLFTVCRRWPNVQRCAVQVGAVKELLLVMQSGCSDSAKVKALKLLKLLRPSALTAAEYGRSDVTPF